jgi:hypothetical protein
MKTVLRGFPLSYPPDQNLIPKGTVFYCDMQDKGNKGIDHSGLKNHVTWSSVTNKSGSYGNRKQFNGSSSYGSIVNSTSVDIINAPLTILMWLNPDSTAVTGYCICKNASQSTDVQYGIIYDAINHRAQLSLEATTRYSSPNNSFNAGTSSLVAFVWDGSYIYCYINGQPSGTPVAFNGTLTSRANLRIGRRESAAAHFKGLMGETWIIKSALHQQDIKNLYKETAWKYGVKI